MSLTLARLDEAIRLQTGDLTQYPGSMRAPLLEFNEICDYARERAAREYARSLLPEDGLLSLAQIWAGPGRGSKWDASLCVPFRTAASSGFQPTPTEAWLALAQALLAQKETQDAV
jgi:hypothetical protein